MNNASQLAGPMLVHSAKCGQASVTPVLWVTTSQPFSRRSSSGLCQAAEFISMSLAVLLSSYFINSDHLPQAHQESNQASKHKRNSTKLFWLSTHLLEIIILNDAPAHPGQSWGTQCQEQPKLTRQGIGDQAQWSTSKLKFNVWLGLCAL